MMVNNLRSEGIGDRAQGDIAVQSRIPEPQSHVTYGSWLELGLHSYVKMLIIGGLFYYLFHNEIDTIVRRWVRDPNWSHGFLIPFFSLYFVNQHKKEILSLQPKPNYLGLFFLVCAVVFYPLNIAHFQYGYLRPICMIATLGAVVLFLGGWPLARYLSLPVGFLVFAVPLPQRYYVSLTMPMRHLAAQVAAALLDLVREMEATASGVVIDVIYKGQRLEPPLNVAEACSGMRLLMAFLALGVAMAYLHHRPIWQRLALLVSTIPIAILCNIVRVTVTGFIYVLIHPKYTQGIYHDILGLAMLPLAFGLYGFLAWFMSSLFIEEAEAVEDIVIRRRKKGDAGYEMQD
ncbi:MAG: exosortase/archaeosortase family protein [Planctomycetota bacterium]